MSTILTLSKSSTTILEFRNNGDVYYNYQGDLKKVESHEEISEAFKYCVIGYTGEEPDNALFSKYLDKIDNGELTDKQLIEIEKRIRKLKLKKLG